MHASLQTQQTASPEADGDNEIAEYGRTTIRLSLGEWLLATVLIAGVLVVTPTLWNRREPLPSVVNYRIPYALNDDYWWFERTATSFVEDGNTLVIGDSAIWGEFTLPDQTLPSFLSQHSAKNFANGGLNGLHPLAMLGLIRIFVDELDGAHVMVHVNPLWLTSPHRDLQTVEAQQFNHPALVSQFPGAIPAYHADSETRLARVVDRSLPVRLWVRHLQLAHFDGLDVPSWTTEHPYVNPLQPLRLPVPAPSQKLRHRPIDWSQRGINLQDFPWVELANSLQWGAIREIVDALRGAGASVFVLVGPFNEHLLTPASRERFGALQSGMKTWLARNEVFNYAPPPLPSDEYADASHPLAAGYERLAKQLAENRSFQAWIEGDRR